MSNIKFICLTRMSTQNIIYSIINKIDIEEENTVKSESKKVVQQIIHLELSPEERQKIKTQTGNWFCKIDDLGFMYLILSSQNYPERHAYELISQIQKPLKKIANVQEQEDTTIKFNIKTLMAELLTRYDDLDNIDKINQAQARLEEVKIEVEDNVKKILSQQGDLQKLDNQTGNLSDQARQFQKQSHTLETIMLWRRRKLNIIIFLVILGIALYILVPIIKSMSKKK